MLPFRLLQSLHSPLYLCSRPALTLWPAASRLIFRQLEEDMMDMENDLERRMQPVYQAYPLMDMDRIRRAAQSRRPAEGESPSMRKEGKEDYKLTLDISAFSPQKLTVKTEGKRLIVSGKHEKKEEDEDGSYFHEYREWRREAELPEDVNPEEVLCSLSQDGRLHFQAPRRALPPAPERAIPITVIQNPVEGQQKTAEIKNDQSNGEQEESPSSS
ncbi:heat shock protein 30C-like [Eleutherodactylus coqui]|uniref:heat shock protein 30C-like n=1 Tax=Eleutherodactylus coqui TaxID=57060 RepID=UPI00346251E5